MDSWNDIFNGQFKQQPKKEDKFEKDMQDIFTRLNEITYRLDSISGNLSKIAESLGEMQFDITNLNMKG